MSKGAIGGGCLQSISRDGRARSTGSSQRTFEMLCPDCGQGKSAA
jgi:hypothetical protein